MAQASRLSIQVTSLGFMERLLNIIETNKHPLIAIAGSEGAVGGRLRFLHHTQKAQLFSVGLFFV